MIVAITFQILFGHTPSMSHVAGHGPLLADASGRLAIKVRRCSKALTRQKALPAEIDFYESSHHMHDCGHESPVSVLVQQWLPYFYGTLALEPEVNDDELRVSADIWLTSP
jgi:hypothetical protein